MERIVVNSGLKSFILLDTISETGPTTIAGRRHFSGEQIAMGIEALAQLGAMHVRFLMNFQKHAFLLSIKRCDMASLNPLEGMVRLKGIQTAHGGSAFSYLMRAQQDSRICIEGNFVFAVVDYNDIFKRAILETYYKKVFLCLRSVSESGF